MRQTPDYGTFPDADLEQGLNNWILLDCFHKPKTTGIQKLATILSIPIGLAAALYNAIYTRDLANQLHLSPAAGDTLSISSYLPLSGLLVISCNDVFRRLVTSNSQHYQQIATRHRLGRKQLGNFASLSMAIFGTVTMVYVSHTGFAQYSNSKSLLILSDVPSSISRMMLYYWTNARLFKALGDFCYDDLYMRFRGGWQPNSQQYIEYKRYQLKKNLRKAIKTLRLLTDAEIDTLFAALRTSERVDMEATRNLDGLTQLIDLTKRSYSSPRSGYFNFFRALTSGTAGTVVGLLSAYIVVPVGTHAARAICNALGFDPIISENIATAFGWLTGICVAPVFIHTTQDSVEQIYDACGTLPGVCTNLPNLLRSTGCTEITILSLRKALVALSLVLAVFSAIPRVELDLQNLGDSSAFDKLVVVAVAIGAIAQSFWPLDRLADRVFRPGDKRRFLISGVRKIIDELPELRSEYIENMYARFFDNLQTVEVNP